MFDFGLHIVIEIKCIVYSVSKFCWNEIDQMNLEVLKNPDQFMWHRVFENYWIRSVTAIAKYLKINIENIVLSENVTDGFVCETLVLAEFY